MAVKRKNERSRYAEREREKRQMMRMHAKNQQVKALLAARAERDERLRVQEIMIDQALRMTELLLKKLGGSIEISDKELWEMDPGCVLCERNDERMMSTIRLKEPKAVDEAQRP